jgi:hypothetical protein
MICLEKREDRSISLIISGNSTISIPITSPALIAYFKPFRSNGNEMNRGKKKGKKQKLLASGMPYSKRSG